MRIVSSFEEKGFKYNVVADESYDPGVYRIEKVGPVHGVVAWPEEGSKKKDYAYVVTVTSIDDNADETEFAHTVELTNFYAQKIDLVKSKGDRHLFVKSSSNLGKLSHDEAIQMIERLLTEEEASKHEAQV